MLNRSLTINYKTASVWQEHRRKNFFKNNLFFVIFLTDFLQLLKRTASKSISYRRDFGVVARIQACLSTGGRAMAAAWKTLPATPFVSERITN